HRPHTARIWRQPPGHLFDARAKVADLTTIDSIRADVNHSCARLDHVLGDEVGPTRSSHQDVRVPCVRSEVLCLGVADRDGGVALDQKQSCRLADDVASADDNRSCALDSYATSLEQ